MDNSLYSNQPQWNSQPQQANPEGQAPLAQPQPQYGQQAWQSPTTNYMPPIPQQYGQNMPGQYNVPPYAQAQPQQQYSNNFLMRWLMMGIAVRIVLLIVIPLLLCGGCALVAILSSIGR